MVEVNTACKEGSLSWPHAVTGFVLRTAKITSKWVLLIVCFTWIFETDLCIMMLDGCFHIRLLKRESFSQFNTWMHEQDFVTSQLGVEPIMFHYTAYMYKV